MTLDNENENENGNMSHAALAAELRGKILNIPDILGMFSSWPQGRRNKNYQGLRDVIDQLFDRAIPDEKRREKFKKSDFALFCAIWYPDAEWDDLYLCGIFTAWAFLWDDTIDTNEHALSDDFEQACVFRKQSLAYVKYWLRLGDEDTGAEHQGDITKFDGSVCATAGYGVFKEFGQKLCSILDIVQRKRFYNMIKLFAKNTEIEQAERLAGVMPSREHYMEIRLGTTADFIYCCLQEVASKTRLPAWIMDSAPMQACWKECNTSIIIINDILSLKKEMVTDCIISLVPVLVCEGRPLERVIPDLMADMLASRDRFDRSARELEAMVTGTADPVLNAELQRYLDGLRNTVTGTAEYSFYSQRYGITQYLQKDGSVNLTL